MKTSTFPATHLSNQCYSMCFRREANFCAICFTTAITNIVGANTDDTENAQSSFGLSVSLIAIQANQLTDTYCSTDYLLIPNYQAAVRKKTVFTKKNVCEMNFPLYSLWPSAPSQVPSLLLSPYPQLPLLPPLGRSDKQQILFLFT